MFFFVLIVTNVLLMIPSESKAQGLVSSCQGATCSACDIISLANNIIQWLVGIVFLFFAILAVYHGFKLVVSGGDSGAKSAAKSGFTSAFIGLFIMLGAFLVVDTIMRGVVRGSDGEIEGYGPWAEIKCAQQTAPTIETIVIEENEFVATAVVSGGTSVAPVTSRAGMVSLRSQGLTVANWQGTNGPGRTDLVHPTVAQAALRMQNAGRQRFGKQPFQVTAAYAENVGHSANSKHYQGIAIDFQPINGITKEQVAQLAREAGFSYVLIESRHVHADMR
jgi:Type IV secretion system pilin/Peptidase M15